jgi:hypothetical protein
VEQRDFAVWDQVPAGSRLYLRLDAEGAVLARGLVVRSSAGVGIEESDLSHVRLTGGGYVLALDEGIAGIATVNIHFPAPRGRAVLSARVEDAAGHAFKRPFRYAVEGSRGDTFRATLLLTPKTLDLQHGAPH